MLQSTQKPYLSIAFFLLATLPSCLYAQEPPDPGAAPAPIVRHPPSAQPAEPEQAPAPPAATALPPLPYDPGIFDHKLPPAQLAFIQQYDGVPTKELLRDKQFHKILKDIVPDCMFHYGRDMPLDQALDTVLSGSTNPVRIVQNRYVYLSGQMGPYLAGRGFLWLDLQEGIGLGGFFFHPVNGEPTPTVTVFSRQIHEPAILGHSQLPPEFDEALSSWQRQSGIPMVTTRYFISASNRRILLEHDEDFCVPSSSSNEVPDCDKMNSDAADLDLNTAYYLEQVHYATNATAWMIQSGEQIDFVALRDNTCRRGPDPVGCRIRMTHERIGMVARRPAMRGPGRR